MAFIGDFVAAGTTNGLSSLSSLLSPGYAGLCSSLAFRTASSRHWRGGAPAPLETFGALAAKFSNKRK
jgi:hypothetical protein